MATNSKFLPLRIESGEFPRDTKVFLNGVDITCSVRAVTVNLGYNAIPTATLVIYVRPDLEGNFIIQEVENNDSR